MFNPQALKELVLSSLQARDEQGYDVAGLRNSAETLGDASCDALRKLYEEIAYTKMKPSYTYYEPDDLAEIRKLRPTGKHELPFHLSTLELKDKEQGALLGRIIGVILGRPTEDWTSERIKEYLEGAGCYPLDNYIPRASTVKGRLVSCDNTRLRSTREYLNVLRCAEPDDDINYVFLALQLVEKLGIYYTTLDVGFNWLDNVQANWLYGPERTAYINLACYTDWSGRYRIIDEVTLWRVSHYLNDYSEMIGALIRGDVYGYILPGLPERAAELAYRDASFTHVKNGIYGEMFASAMISAAFCSDDAREAIDAGLAEIPENCRLAEAIRNTKAWHDQYGEWQKVYEKIDDNYNRYGAGHTINNAAIIVNALLSAAGSFEKAVCIAVMQGQDTDCTAATAGSVAGIIAGATGIPEKWSAPLNDTVLSCVCGEGRNSIAATAQRIFSVASITTKCIRELNYLRNES